MSKSYRYNPLKLIRSFEFSLAFFSISDQKFFCQITSWSQKTSNFDQKPKRYTSGNLLAKGWRWFMLGCELLLGTDPRKRKSNENITWKISHSPDVRSAWWLISEETLHEEVTWPTGCFWQCADDSKMIKNWKGPGTLNNVTLSCLSQLDWSFCFCRGLGLGESPPGGCWKMEHVRWNTVGTPNSIKSWARESQQLRISKTF